MTKQLYTINIKKIKSPLNIHPSNSYTAMFRREIETKNDYRSK